MTINHFSFVLFCVAYVSSANLVFGQNLASDEKNTSTGSTKIVKNRNAMTDGISGMLLDGMITPNGHQFFQLFSNSWQENSESENYSFRVIETTSRLKGSQVFIYSGSKLFFSSNLPFKSSQLSPLVEQAIEAINTKILSEVLDTGSADKDLGMEEI